MICGPMCKRYMLAHVYALEQIPLFRCQHRLRRERKFDRGPTYTGRLPYVDGQVGLCFGMVDITVS